MQGVDPMTAMQGVNPMAAMQGVDQMAAMQGVVNGMQGQVLQQANASAQPSVDAFATQPSVGAFATQPSVGSFATQPSPDQLAAMQGINPMAAMQGVNPMAAMQGVNPMAAMQGVDPLAAMQGVDPMAAMQGMQQPPPKRQRTFFKSQICRHYLEGNPGSCTMGENCQFAHGEAELGTMRTVDQDNPPPQMMQPMMAAAAAMRAPGSGPVKTKMCTYFQMGTCARGNRCTFAHGELDIGTPYDPSLAPGGGKGEQLGVIGGTNPMNPINPMPSIDGIGAMQTPVARRVGEMPVMDCEQGKLPHPSDPLVMEELESLLVTDPSIADDFVKFVSHELGFADPPGPGETLSLNSFRSRRLPPAAQKTALMFEAMAKSQHVPDFMLKKTKLCTFFMSGQCQRGEACAFAHGEHEIGMPQTGDISVKAMEKVLSGEGSNHTPTFNGLAKGAGGPPPKHTGETFLGIIKSYNDKNAFGFIQSDEVQARYGGDCFFPGRFVQENPGLSVGDMVEFDLGISSKGQPQAIAVRPCQQLPVSGLPMTTPAVMDVPMTAPAASGTAPAVMSIPMTAPANDGTSPAVMSPPMTALADNSLPVTASASDSIPPAVMSLPMTAPAVMDPAPATMSAPAVAPAASNEPPAP